VTTVKVRPDAVIQSPSAPALWVPPLHALLGALVALVGLVWPGLPSWVGALIVLAGIALVAFGVLVYVVHRDHWSRTVSSGFIDNFWDELLPELRSDLAKVEGALPADLAARLEAVEAALAKVGAYSVAAKALSALGAAHMAAEAPQSPPEAAPPPAAQWPVSGPAPATAPQYASSAVAS